METVVWCWIEITLSDDPHASCSRQGHTYVALPHCQLHTLLEFTCLAWVSASCLWLSHRPWFNSGLIIFLQDLPRYRDASFSYEFPLSGLSLLTSRVVFLTLLKDVESVSKKVTSHCWFRLLQGEKGTQGTRGKPFSALMVNH